MKESDGDLKNNFAGIILPPAVAWPPLASSNENSSLFYSKLVYLGIFTLGRIEEFLPRPIIKIFEQQFLEKNYLNPVNNFAPKNLLKTW